MVEQQNAKRQIYEKNVVTLLRAREPVSKCLHNSFPHIGSKPKISQTS